MKYEMLADSEIEPKVVKGTIVYALRGYDYGLARDDERVFGFPCKSVTMDENGGYPSFVVPLHHLKVIL